MDPLSKPLTCFKAYDIRGRLDDELTDDVAFRVGHAAAETLGARQVVVARDVRPSSARLCTALADGLMAGGSDVLDLGLAGTEEVYFATAHLAADAGICVTASHNPLDYNGMKLVRRGSAPIGPTTGMAAIKALAERGDFASAPRRGRLRAVPETRAAYVDKILTFSSAAVARPLNILVNAGNGAAGPTFDAIARGLEDRGSPYRFLTMNHTPDGTFPNGIPNPLLPENQAPTSAEARSRGVDFAVAWDGDFDRCFLFDHEGTFIPGEYIVGLLAEAMLLSEPGARIVHDPRVIWGTREAVAEAGGIAIQSPCGHTNLKQAMRDHGAIYGGEMSGHHYFRDFFACDSGMIPWLLVADLISLKGISLRDLVAERRRAFPSSGEINFTVADPKAILDKVEGRYAAEADVVDRMDGLGMSFADWRFNLRASNTEPLLRLNVEARGKPDLVAQKVAEIREQIET